MQISEFLNGINYLQVAFIQGFKFLICSENICMSKNCNWWWPGLFLRCGALSDSSESSLSVVTYVHGDWRHIRWLFGGRRICTTSFREVCNYLKLVFGWTGGASAFQVGSTPVVSWLSYSPLDPRIAGSNPAGVDEFFSESKNLEYDFLRKRVKSWVPRRKFRVRIRTSSRN